MLSFYLIVFNINQTDNIFTNRKQHNIQRYPIDHVFCNEIIFLSRLFRQFQFFTKTNVKFSI